MRERAKENENENERENGGGVRGIYVGGDMTIVGVVQYTMSAVPSSHQVLDDGHVAEFDTPHNLLQRRGVCRDLVWVAVRARVCAHACVGGWVSVSVCVCGGGDFSGSRGE